MNINTLLLPFICVLAVSCTSNKIRDTSATTCPDQPTPESLLDPYSSPSPTLPLPMTLMYFKVVNQRYPVSLVELSEFCQSDTNAPNLNPAEFDVLEFDPMEDGSLIINSELKGDPPLTTATGPIFYGTSKKDTQGNGEVREKAGEVE